MKAPLTEKAKSWLKGETKLKPKRILNWTKKNNTTKRLIDILTTIALASVLLLIAFFMYCEFHYFKLI